MTGPNHPFLAACRREKTPYTPVWLMRQAGRYMKEYRDLRAKFSFLELCKRPDLAAEITVTPVERLGVDAAILFADILLILEPMGVELEYSKEDGPLIHSEIVTRTDVEKLLEFDPEEALPFVLETVRKSRAALNGKVPLIGFSGAPFTLASYLIEGGSSRNYLRTKTLIYSNPGAWRGLMERLSAAVSKYLNAQISAGVEAVQLFDSWVGCLSPDDYQRYVLPYTRATIAALTSGIPVIHFSTGTAGLLKSIRAAGGDIIGVDWRVRLDEAWQQIGHDVAIQGNLDPAALLAAPKEIRNRVTEILQRAGGRPGHIFNLGHGVLPETPVEHVVAMVEAVHELSSR
ncbi:MAG: uroporphyrinogen decarboxylase [Deltaproteobacteria bacterium]|nr:uroporphyrinogen decarboxylase [Deltaproteobacteria bacterium]MBI2210759.1 uroporphyrinogen decarboxylase [Deltaproteobacteria bacterium]